MLEDEGFLLFDDYLWAELGEDPLLRPRPAIDAFLSLVEGKYELLFAHEQVAFANALSERGNASRKSGYWPTISATP
jgi:hypothetical protein